MAEHEENTIVVWDAQETAEDRLPSAEGTDAEEEAEDPLPEWMSDMESPDRSMPETVLAVLIKGGRPMRAEQVIEAIKSADWLPQIRKAEIPEQRNASAHLYTLTLYDKVVEKLSRGVYVVHPDYDGKSLKHQHKAKKSPAKKRKSRTHGTASPLGDVDAVLPCYGISWDREKVDWSRTRGKVLGNLFENDTVVDFSQQVGVYVLYDRKGTVVYVGRTIDGSLYGRLRQHTHSSRRAARWTHFSWFGLKPVLDDFSLGEKRRSLDQDEEIVMMESLLIELLVPAFNDKGGDNIGSLYWQVEDPALVERRHQEMRDQILHLQKQTWGNM